MSYTRDHWGMKYQMDYADLLGDPNPEVVTLDLEYSGEVSNPGLLMTSLQSRVFAGLEAAHAQGSVEVVIPARRMKRLSDEDLARGIVTGVRFFRGKYVETPINTITFAVEPGDSDLAASVEAHLRAIPSNEG